MAVTAGASGFGGSITSSATAAVNFSNVESFADGALVTGTVFNDANNNGTQDAGEAVVGGVTVFLDADNDGQLDAGEAGVRGVTVFLDLDGDGRLDANEPKDATDSTGAYELTTTRTGSFFVRTVLSPVYLRASGFPQVNLSAGGSATADVGLFTNLPPQATPARRLAAGLVRGGKNFVKPFGDDGAELAEREVFVGVATRDVRVAVADVTGDGVEDVVVGTGPGVPAQVVVLDGTTLQEVARLTPFEAGFTGGVFVAAGDVNPDGAADVIVTPDEGGGPRVAAYQGGVPGSFQQIGGFLGIDDVNFRGGARVTIADVNRDGVPDLIVAAGFGGGPRVVVYDGASAPSGRLARLFNDFFMFESTLRNGAFVTAGDLDGEPPSRTARRRPAGSHSGGPPPGPC